MAHEISIRENGFAEFACTKTPAWHGLGQMLEVGADLATWKKSAGMDWEVFESAVSYNSMTGTHTFPDKKALFRSDTKGALSIVGNDFKIVQPGDVLEFFRDLVDRHDMQLSTAGVLFGGKRFWALAETGREITLGNSDKVKGNLLLITAVDGSLATTAKFVSTRVVCNNTLTVAMGEKTRNLVKRTHKVDWDPAEVKLDLGLIDASWNNFMDRITKMAATPMNKMQATDFFQKMFYNPDVAAEDQSWGAARKVNQMLALMDGGIGADLSKGTVWGALNAITEAYTHGSGKRDQNHQFWEGHFGENEKVKNKAFTMLSDLVAA